MKVAIIANVLSFHSSFNQDNIRILKEFGCDVHLFSNYGVASQKTLQFKDYCFRNDVKIHYVDIPRSPFNILSLYQSYRHIDYLFLKCDFGFVHSHTPVGGFLSRLLSKKHSVKNIYTAHGFHFFKGAPFLNWLIYYPVEKLLSKYSDAIITINKEDFAFSLQKMNTKTYYIPGVGIEYVKFTVKSQKSEHGVLNLLSIGELNNNKNHDFVINSINNINKVIYIIAGDGILKKELKLKISNLGLDTKVRLLGYVDDVFDLYSKADIFVFPSKREGLPVSLLEAMASGLPIIASNIRGNRDLIDDGKGGFLFDLNRLDDFEEKLKILLTDEALRLQMGSYNRNKAKMYDINYISDKMKDIYSNFIK